MRLVTGRQLIYILLVALPLVMIAAVLLGPTNISINNLIYPELHPQDWMIFRELRLPRAILAGLIGAVLAMSGAVLQGLFRNPLADPSLIGVNAGATVGASLSIVIGSSLVTAHGLGGLSIVALGSFTGSVITVWLIYQLSTGPRGTSVSTMLLVGIAMTALGAALHNLMNFLADNEMLRRMALWQMGNLDLAGWSRVQICLPMIAVFLLLLRNQANPLNALLLGESEARHLGIDVNSMKKRLILLTALGIGVCTALAGTIAFVGLIVPHLVRVICGPDHRILLLASGLLGAILLVLADLLARIVIAPAELPVGAITAFLGVPFFIYLLRHQTRSNA